MVSNELTEILTKMTRAEAIDRYQSAPAVLADLDKLNLPDENNRVPHQPPSWKRIAAGLVIGLSCISAGLIYSHTQPAAVNIETEAMLDRSVQTTER